MKPTDQWQVPLINKQVSPFPKSGLVVRQYGILLSTLTSLVQTVQTLFRFFANAEKKVQLCKQVLASTVFVKTLWDELETCRLQKIQCTMYERG